MRKSYYSEGNIYFCIDSRYQIEEILGKGSYGTVCRAVEIVSVGEPSRIAIKRITDIFKKEVLLKRAIRELKLMKHFKGHKNVSNLKK
jgi:mitogen-activated protein kinase